MIVNDQDFEALIESMYPDWAQAKARSREYYQNKVDRKECEVYSSPCSS
jgi:hypothetical protein